MPSTGFHRPGPLPTTDLEALALAAAVDQGLEAHVLTWYGDLLLVHVDGTWPEVHSYRDLVADRVVEALDDGHP